MSSDKEYIYNLKIFVRNLVTKQLKFDALTIKDLHE